MINVAHPLSIVLISAGCTALMRLTVPSLSMLSDRAASLAAAIAGSPVRSAAIVFLFSLAISAIPSSIYGVPVPLVHDEFAYLLQGDTFAHGRLTNPPHPMSEFLETFHLIQHPTYAAKFPPGQGLALALGFRLGLPILGVWLSIAFACVAVEWALRAFVSPRLALLGALLCASHPLIAWWSQSYWGGGIAMLGGALLFGSIARLRNRRTRNAIWVAIRVATGLSVLALSRPLEGLILSILLLPTAAQSVFAPGGIRSLARSIAPVTTILALTALFILHYNDRVTGNRFTFPYIAHARQSMVAPLLHFQPLNNPAASPYKIFNDFHAMIELQEFESARWYKKIPLLVQKYIDPVPLVIPLIASLFTFRAQRGSTLAWILIAAVPAIHMLLTPWMRPQYMAPLVAPLFLLIVVGLRELARRNALTLALFVIIAPLVAAIATIRPQAALAHDPLATQRARLIDDLTARGGKHLVLVTYGPHHVPQFEFVFNRADIDNSPVVFARSMGAQKDRALLSYFHDRTLWDLYYDDTGVYRVTRR